MSGENGLVTRRAPFLTVSGPLALDLSGCADARARAGAGRRAAPGTRCRWAWVPTKSLWRQRRFLLRWIGPEWSEQVADTPGHLRSGSADGRHHCPHGSVRSAARETSARQLSLICCRVRAELSAGGQSPARRSRQACHGCPCDGLQCLGTAAATRRTNAGRCDRRPNLVRNSNPAGAYRLAS